VGHRTPAPAHANPLSGLNMRVTYRTLRVLSAIGELPGASNRAIAERAGISDQGQTSKLLARLQGLGLIENGEPGRREGARFKGEANRWTLTARGAQVVAAVDGRAGSRSGIAPVTGSSPAAPARPTRAP
jgi:DNA-binding IclR family transcriptional regulator